MAPHLTRAKGAYKGIQMRQLITFQNTHTQTHRHTDTHTRTQTHTHTNTRANTHQLHASTHTRAHTDTHIHTRTYAHWTTQKEAGQRSTIFLFSKPLYLKQVSSTCQISFYFIESTFNSLLKSLQAIAHSAIFPDAHTRFPCA